jgi:zinc transporter, ZIP family
MEIADQSPLAGLRGAWVEHARKRPWTSLALAVLAVLLMLVSSLWRVAAGEADASPRLAMLGGVVVLGATALGALPGLVLHGINQRLEDGCWGWRPG